MDIKSGCPCCGVHTVVQLTQEEKDIYYKYGKKKLPSDFSERAVCDCCLDDGYKFKGDGFSLYSQISRII